MGWIEEVPRHKIKMVESIRLIPREERIKKIKERVQSYNKKVWACLKVEFNS